MQSLLTLVKQSGVLVGTLIVVAALTLSGCADSFAESSSSDGFGTCRSCTRTAGCSSGHCPYATTVVSESDGEFSPSHTVMIPAQIDPQPLATSVPSTASMQSDNEKATP
jgi:hypothetical protein